MEFLARILIGITGIPAVLILACIIAWCPPGSALFVIAGLAAIGAYICQGT
jgi:hypothetical protein